VKYVLLIHPDAATFADLDEEERQRITAEFVTVTQTPGILASGQLHPPDTATTIRVEGQRTLTTDGPFIEAKEALGGFMVYEADNLDAAIELAARIPAARMGGSVEVRPIVGR
jgi:hypothetical protein